MKKTTATLLLVGSLQIAHAASHIIPAVQSAAIISNQQYEDRMAQRLRQTPQNIGNENYNSQEISGRYENPFEERIRRARQNLHNQGICNHHQEEKEEGSISKLLYEATHNKYAGYVWGLLGLLSIGVGVADARKHKRQDKKIEGLQQELEERNNYITELERKVA